MRNQAPSLWSGSTGSKTLEMKVKVAQSCPALCNPKEFSRSEYWSGLPFPSPGSLPNPGIKPRCPTLQADALPFEPPGKSFVCYCHYYYSECLCAYSCISHSDHCLWGKILDGKLLAYLTSLNYLPGPTPGSSPNNSSLSPWPLLEGASPDSGLF